MIWRRKNQHTLTYETDFHSHLLPGVDDGVKSVDQTYRILRELQGLGIKRVITTPHIYEEIYPNSEEGLRQVFEEVKKEMPADITIDFQLAAEYFVDEFFYEKIKAGKELLTLPGQFVLIETSFFGKSVLLEQVLFKLRSEGYKPVLAHPERYQYLAEDPSLVHRYIELGASLQVNAGSLAGHYGKHVQRFAEDLVVKRLVSLIGSDIHKETHVKNLEIARKSKIFKKGLAEEIKNDAWLSP
jgi:tyrosine-protein phosphatase YwqE